MYHLTHLRTKKWGKIVGEKVDIRDAESKDSDTSGFLFSKEKKIRTFFTTYALKEQGEI